MNTDQASSEGSEIGIYCESAFGKKAENPVVLDVRDLTSISDYFIILSGRSNRHVKSIGEFIREDLKKKGKQPLSVAGMKDGQPIDGELVARSQPPLEVVSEQVADGKDESLRQPSQQSRAATPC